MKMITIVGARPQFIKAAVISRAIARHNQQNNKQIEEHIVHTGQHFDTNMSDIFFEEMRIPKPEYYLNISGGSHGAMTGRMLEKIEEVLQRERPDIVLVYGDTNSTLAGALAAVKLHIPVAHVEAGLRSYNQHMPEEINRILTDRISRWLFCPTDTAVENLAKEGVKSGSSRGQQMVINVGDVMYDAMLFYRKIAQPSEPISSLIAKCKDGFYLATVHRAENTDDSSRLQSIIAALNSISSTTPVILPIHPRTRNLLEQQAIVAPNIYLIDPVSYFDMNVLLSKCKAVFTDSGGVQKEAYFFEKPCITLRDETEWVELVEHGYNVLVGANYDKILQSDQDVSAIVFDKTKALYGNGNAGQLIVQKLAENLR